VGTTVTSAVLLAVLVAGVLYQTYLMRQRESGGGAAVLDGGPALASDFAGL
jgi:hypothetical protein